jgi:hypothetical protein
MDRLLQDRFVDRKVFSAVQQTVLDEWCWGSNSGCINQKLAECACIRFISDLTQWPLRDGINEHLKCVREHGDVGRSLRGCKNVRCLGGVVSVTDTNVLVHNLRQCRPLPRHTSCWEYRCHGPNFVLELVEGRYRCLQAIPQPFGRVRL